MSEAPSTRRDVAGTLRTGLTVLLTVALLVALAGTVYVAVNPPETGTPYTEFYVLNESGVAADYQTNLTVGEEGTTLVSVRNREQETVTYTLVVHSEEETRARRTLSLRDGEAREFAVSYAFDEPGSVRLQFDLYRGESGTGEPYRQARLLLRVAEPAG